MRIRWARLLGALATSKVAILTMGVGPAQEPGDLLMPAPIRVDHASVRGRDLAAMRKVFADAGLAPDYGGPHASGITHMALLGFEDGS